MAGWRHPADRHPSPTPLSNEHPWCPAVLREPSPSRESICYEAGTFRGYAYFFPDGTPLAPAVIDAVNGAIYVHFNLSQLSGVLQLLRKERPVYLYEFGPSNAGLMTGGEPTGEEEGLSG